MVRLENPNDPLLGRPLALYRVADDDTGEPTFVDVVYLVLGRMTKQLAKLRQGAAIKVWGPLGNGFPLIDAEHLVMVAGGIGQTPFLAVAQEYLGARNFGRPAGAGERRATLCYGVRRASLVAGDDDFRTAGIDLRLASDDGSVGHHGLVTDLLREVLAEQTSPPPVVLTCGPEPMMHAVADICAASGVTCYASLETPMACGLGICFSCVAPMVEPDGGWDYRRTCVEGPVFDATQIAWQAM
jgi:dihydroorotate dehydrogenase electron transfer subunit